MHKISRMIWILIISEKTRWKTYFSVWLSPLIVGRFLESTICYQQKKLKVVCVWNRNVADVNNYKGWEQRLSTWFKWTQVTCQSLDDQMGPNFRIIQLTPRSRLYYTHLPHFKFSSQLKTKTRTLLVMVCHQPDWDSRATQ